MGCCLIGLDVVESYMCVVLNMSINMPRSSE